MHLNCPECSCVIQADDVNLVKTIAKCRECNNIFEFTNELKAAGLPVLFRQRQEIMIPDGVEVLRLQSMLEIMVKWRHSAKYFTIFFAIVWNLFVFFFSIIVILMGEWVAILFMMPFWLMGGWLIYSGLSYLVNTTYITVDERMLTVVHKPISFLMQKNQIYAPEEVKQLYVQRYTVGKTNGTPVYAFMVSLNLKNGQTVSLVKGLKTAEYAGFIEQEIEHYLGIKDRPIEGEWAF